MQKDATGGAGQSGGGEMTGLLPINKPSPKGRHKSCGQG